MKETVFNEKKLLIDIKREARAIGIPVGAADIFAGKAMEGIKKKLEKRKTLTKQDLERIVAIELKKYNADLAYVYTIRDKII